MADDIGMLRHDNGAGPWPELHGKDEILGFCGRERRHRSCTLPPSGRSFRTWATMWTRWQDGKAVEERHHLHMLGMLAQIGALPAPSTTWSGGAPGSWRPGVTGALGDRADFP
jgi:hypothetical protein